ncbi:pyrimidine 5'-nucleotidase [Pseudochelatococcus contaminans]|uniref:Putative hydrolase of the HAD superfamily n=1 Tax=Pseudochelatococcus contaminans TaxID=1538103 RepID=A0A7W5Z492_9HYPH|nr:pyrimidine 5'-nucleotidase [Pseudochelatococcus contaminans]MBB3809773.1 putative hydrolase of the HAD superfamily [Pseudochelatococcus contaminans]
MVDKANGASVAGNFTHVDTWIFDLDNTLYSHESNVWPQVDERITLYISSLLGLDAISSRALQKFYYYRYGTTLRGLMHEFHVDPHAFLDFAHDIDYSALTTNEPLKQAIERLPGRRFILTNGSRGHAGSVVSRLGIEALFEDTFDIVDAEFIPKPEAQTYARFLDRFGIDPARAAMFEDLSVNLAVPHQLGMQTVLVLPATHDPHREAHEQALSKEEHVAHHTSDLPDFLGGITPKTL